MLSPDLVFDSGCCAKNGVVAKQQEPETILVIAYHSCRQCRRSEFDWEHEVTRLATTRLRPRTGILEHGVKAFEKSRFRPMYAQANMGHPSRKYDLG
jgi:hypothetical protein